MNVSGIICAELNSAEGIFVSFPSWLKHVKSGSKIAPFFNWALFLDLISKMKTIAVFRRKLFKLHTHTKKEKKTKQNTILHVIFTFSLKQGETRTSSGFIWVPLTGGNWQKWKRVFLTCPCHEIYRDEAVGLKSCKNTWKITIFVKMWNLEQYREHLIFCQ